MTLLVSVCPFQCQDVVTMKIITIATCLYLQNQYCIIPAVINAKDRSKACDLAKESLCKLCLYALF